MGRLIHQARDLVAYLQCENSIGRDLNCRLRLTNDRISRFHAMINWDKERWTIRDLGSRNGTYLNGQRVVSGAWLSVKKGDVLIFGDISEKWHFDDDSEPKDMLIPKDKSKNPILLPDLLPLPDSKNPLLTIFKEGKGSFLVEKKSGELCSLQHGELISLKNNKFKVHLTILADETSNGTKTNDKFIKSWAWDNVKIDIRVAPDEESASTMIYIDEQKYFLQPRAHLYLLAHLARLRIADTKKRGLLISNNNNETDDLYGWIDCRTLYRDLLIDPEYLTQQVFRIRQDFKRINPSIASVVIDRQIRGKIRIGFSAKQLSVCNGFF